MIAGNRTSLEEVAGSAGLLVDPFDESAIAQGLAEVLERPDLRAQLRVKGLERAAAFSWRTTARLTLQSYERAAAAAKLQR